MSSFLQYPEPREGPPAPYYNEDQDLPVFRGAPLAIGATLIQNIGLVQSYFWRNAGFGVIHDIPQLRKYTPRFDPTVIPIKDTTKPLVILPAPSQKRKGDGNYYTSADYHALYTSGKLTPLDVVNTLLPLVRRDAIPPGRHSVAFIESQAERIRTAAEASTKRYQGGTPLGPLDGIPVAVKDEVHMEGYKRTLGSKLDFTGDFEGTSWCVKKWEEAGAIVIGKTTMHELGLDTTNNNPNYGTPRNPHNPNYYTGGSSGGSGYVVGAGLVPIALGADGGGSIRIPSSFCGIWGLKTSHSRVSAAPTVSVARTTGVLGPMAASVDDLALAYRVMAAPAPEADDAASSAFPHPLTSLTTDARPKNKTIGIVKDWIDRAERPVREVFDRALAFYRKKGYTVVDISIPYLPEGQRAHVLTIMTEIASALTPKEISQITAANKVLVSMGKWQITGQDFFASQQLRNLLMNHLSHLFQTHPGLLILSPSTPLPGWKIGSPADLSRGVSDSKTSVRNMEYVWLANFTGCPAINCPAGYVKDGSHVPIGLMAMGEWGAEEDLIAFARDGEPILDLPENRINEDSSGLQVPCGKHSLWEDVLGKASEKSSA